MQLEGKRQPGSVPCATGRLGSALQADHEPRVWPDDRYSSNTWGPLPPRSYFRFDEAAVASERESLEMQGIPLPEAVSA